MSRCMICGRRWAQNLPRCGHEQSASSLLQSAELPASRSGMHGPSAPGQVPVQVPGYAIRQLLGRGGFGTVFAATRTADGLEVALKVAHYQTGDTKAHERLFAEAAALRLIGPPVVPLLYDVGTLPDGSPYLAMERISLPSLDSMLGDPVSLEHFLKIAAALTAVLAAVHKRGYLHRDLKPENIFLTEAVSEARLVDFGLAKPLAERTPDTEPMSLGTIVGTPVYMSPEQCEGRTDLDPRTDLYAAGIILYEALTGRPPFFGKSAEVRDAHINHRPPPPSHLIGISPMFDRVLLRCLSKKPEHRFATAEELCQAIAEAAQGESSVLAPRAPARPRTDVPSEPVLLGLLFFRATTSTGEIIRQVQSLGGHLVAASGEICAAAFGVSAGKNPIERAVQCAQAMLDHSIAEWVIVDRERARVHVSPRGAQRVMTAAFRDHPALPEGEVLRGVLMTAAAAELTTRVKLAPDPGPGDFLRVMAPDDVADIASSELGPIVGRERQLGQLITSAKTAVLQAVPTIASVIAEVGYGKSHLGEAVATRLRTTLRAARVVEIRAHQPLGIERDRVLQSLLRAAMPIPSEPPADFGRALFSEHIGEEIAADVWPAVALMLGWLPADAPEVRKLSAAPSALRAAVAQAIGEALRRIAAHTPLCILIDDAQYADEIALDALEYATLAEARAPLWICVLAEPIFLRARPSWAGMAARALQVRLSLLTPQSAALLCVRLLHPANHVPKPVIDRLVAWTGGNPLILTELIRSAKRQGLIRRHSRGDAWYVAGDVLDHLPELPQVDWLAERELAALSAELGAAARLAALLGAEFTVAEVEGVLHELEEDGFGRDFPLDAWVSVTELLTCDLLLSRDDGHFEFRHVLIRERIARTTPAEQRRQIHRAAFRYYRDVPLSSSPSPVSTQAPVLVAMSPAYRAQRLAWHAEHSGLIGTAAATYLHLAEMAQSRHDYVDAELLYSRALELLPEGDTPTRMAAQNGRALMRYRLSRFADALEDLRGARAIAARLGDRWATAELLLDEATVLDWMREFDRSEAAVREAEAVAERVPSERLSARLSLAWGRTLVRMNRFAEAIPLLEAATASAERLGDPGYETMIIALLLLGSSAAIAGHIEQANEVFERAIAISQARGDKLHLAGALNNRHDLWIAQKDVSSAARDALRAQRIGREIGQSHFEYTTSYNLAEIHYFAGDLDAAWPHVRRAVEIEAHNAQQPHAKVLSARILVYGGDDREAAEVLAEIRADQDSARSRDDAGALLSDVEVIFCDAAALVIARAGSAAWHPLRARAEAVMAPFELAELVELMALATLHQAAGSETGDAARVAEVRALYSEALDLAQREPHAIELRILKQMRALFLIEAGAVGQVSK